jgi:hypothetical protein
LPAPNKGLDVTQQLIGADPLTAIRLENLIPRVYGCELRSGYQRWVSNLDGEVRTLLPFISASGTATLFAATSAGSMYDVTAEQLSSVTPVPLETLMGGTVAGQWSYVTFTNDAGSFLLAVCAGAGYWTYDPTNGWVEVATGTTPGQIDGVDPSTLDYVFVWKSRVWFLQVDSAIAYYLPVNQITGAVKPFNFGPFMPHGGSLCFGANWTVDGGEGMDDKLILVGFEGDVVMYQGTDPDTAADFNMIGRWYIGHMPLGRRGLSRYSADVMMLSERGLVFLTELLRGEGFFANSATAERVNPWLASEFSESSTRRYWEIRFLPHEQLLVVNVPATSGFSSNTQLAFEVNTKAFFTLTGIPVLTLEAFNQGTYSGDHNGNVWKLFTGESDGRIDDVPGKDLEGALVTAFSPLGEGVRLKRFLMVRPSFIAKTAPSVVLALNPDWSFRTPSVSPSFAVGGESMWDSARWDEGVWSGSSRSYAAWVGITGTGYYGALSMKMSGLAGSTFVSWQVLIEPGGIL